MMNVGEHKYELRNISVHAPSEHFIGEKRQAMELQLHHEDNYGNMVSIAILFDSVDELSGEFKDTFGRSDFWEGYISQKTYSTGKFLNVLPYLPAKKADLHFYSYHGSQTHPPCEEGIQWFVMHKIVQAKKAHVDHLMKQFNNNARPQQPSLGRKVTFF